MLFWSDFVYIAGTLSKPTAQHLQAYYSVQHFPASAQAHNCAANTTRIQNTRHSRDTRYTTQLEKNVHRPSGCKHALSSALERSIYQSHLGLGC